MKYWAEFYDLHNNAWVKPYGSFSIIRLDGRLSRGNMHTVAKRECAKRGFAGYSISRGNNLLNLFALTASVVPVNDKQPAEE